MSKYRITLEGKTYEMEVELLFEDNITQSATPKGNIKVKSAPSKTAVKSTPPVQKQVANNTGTVTAPMPGTVIRIEKGEGQSVKAGELVLILEAMKMENEIFSPADGTIIAMHCTAGGTVAGGDVLFEVK